MYIFLHLICPHNNTYYMYLQCLSELSYPVVSAVDSWSFVVACVCRLALIPTCQMCSIMVRRLQHIIIVYLHLSYHNAVINLYTIYLFIYLQNPSVCTTANLSRRSTVYFIPSSKLDSSVNPAKCHPSLRYLCRIRRYKGKSVYINVRSYYTLNN